MMTTPPHSPSQLPAFHIGLTHFTAPTSQLQINHPTPSSTEFTLGTDVIVIVLSIVTDPASAHPDETDIDRSRFTWPPWQGHTIPEAHQKWKAVFGTSDRTFRGIYYEAPTLEETQTIHVRPGFALSDAMWKMLQNAPCAVLCTGLTGDPSAAEITAGLEEGILQAVLVEALFA
ncbi:hypothetical protein AB0465_40225 [Streptomyces griseoviridis]|uniref:hypothetical protein n=1 Tax=Streptomyces griseoviridis TaxID=45398 RepID=UPI00344CF102